MPVPRTSIWIAALAAAVLLGIGGVYAELRYERSDVRQRAEAMTSGDAARGRALFVAKGCGGCHSVDGVAQATGLVGPPLDGIGGRAVIAGVLENTPDNLMHWIADPQSVIPGNAMPNLPMSEQERRDIAAFLYSIG